MGSDDMDKLTPVGAERLVGDDLLRIVGINEEIKSVVSVAFKINIMALNAIFLAKRAGTSARGFGVLSNELRVFSQDLRRNMETLRRVIHGSVTEVSRLLQESRQHRILRTALEMTPATNRYYDRLPAVVERSGAAAAEGARRLAALRRELKSSLEDAFRLVELGGVLAKSAKIEAAYGNTFAAALSQVSAEFDGIVEDIRMSLESLRKSSFFEARA